MNVRKVREGLGRVRTCVQRGEYPKAVQLVCAGLKECGSQPAPTDLRGDFRTALGDICSHAEYKKFNARPISYQAGKEKDILAYLQKFYTQLTGQQEEEEDYETALQRKLNLDRCINNGKAFVSQGKFTEADDCFTEALKYYKTEIAAFGIMARAMMDANQFVRALGYVRKGLEIQPDNVDLNQLGAECNRKRAKSPR